MTLYWTVAYHPLIRSRMPQVSMSVSRPPALTVEGWLMKRGRGFPHAWQRRYFIFERATCRLTYYAPSATDENSPGG